MPTLLALPTPSPSSPVDQVTKGVTDALSGACGVDPSPACTAVYNLTGSKTVAGFADIFVARPLQIALVVLVALVLRVLAFRLINRTVARTAHGSGSLRLLRSAPVLAEAAQSIVAERRRQRAETIGSVLRSITVAAIFAVAFVMILGELGLNLAPIVASAGIVGVAVGFGAQNLVRDFLTGIFMILEDQYGVGDIIDAGPASGTVEAVGLRTTRLRDVSGVVWHIRNGEITRIGNMSQGWSRALLDVSVGYGTSVPHAKEVIKRVADGVWQDPVFGELVLEEPEVWGLERLSVDGLDVRLVVKTVPLEQWKVARELRERIKAAFDEEGIEMPFPQRTLSFRDPVDQAELGRRARTHAR